jgi:CDP-4-dehydro-6-deoxyglucose reductase
MAFLITLQNTDQPFFAKAYDTILDSAVSAGHNIPYGCRNGTCGSCKGTILAGSVDYGDYAQNALTENEKAAGKALFCCARPLSDLTIQCRESLPDLPPPRILPVRVEKKLLLADDVLQLVLKLPKTEKLTFKAGQYIEFLLKDGQRRAFSIANAPHIDDAIELHLRLVSGGAFTEYAFNEMSEKTIMRIEAPLGSFFLRENSEKPLIMLAGGTGFAPMKGIIEYMLHESIQRDIYLYWGARSLKDLYMHALVQAWTKEYRHIHYIPVLSNAGINDNWTGRTGYAHQAVLEDMQIGNHSNLSFKAVEVYCCGAPIMVESAQQAFMAAGLAEDAFFADVFSYAKPIL